MMRHLTIQLSQVWHASNCVNGEYDESTPSTDDTRTRPTEAYRQEHSTTHQFTPPRLRHPLHHNHAAHMLASLSPYAGRRSWRRSYPVASRHMPAADHGEGAIL